MKLGAKSAFMFGIIVGVGAVLSVGVLAFASEDRPSSRDASRGEPSHAPLAVFERGQTPRDAVPASVAATLRGLEGNADVVDELRPGQLVLERSRLLLADLDARGADLYAFPSEKGRICYALTAGPQGCVGRFSVEQPVSWSVFDHDGLGAGRPTAVFELTPNNIKGVDVGVGGTTRAARMANNAYFLEMSDGTALPDRLIVRFANGRSTTIDLSELRRLGY